METTPCLRSNQTVITGRGAGANTEAGRRGDLAGPGEAVGGGGHGMADPRPSGLAGGHRRSETSSVNADGACQHAGVYGQAQELRGHHGPRVPWVLLAQWFSGDNPPVLPSRNKRGGFPGVKPTGVLLRRWRTLLLGMHHAAPVCNINLTRAVTVLFMVVLM